MNCYILVVVSMIFNLNNTIGNPRDDHFFKVTSTAREIVLNKTDSTKLRSIQINTIKKNDSLKSKSNNLSAKKSSKNIVTYSIYFDGRIEKFIPKIITKENEKKYKYVYYDEQGIKYDLGDFKIQKTQMYKRPKGNFINLINLEEVPKYYKKNNHQYHFNIDSQRSYVNEKSFASFIGAMFEVNYLDIGCNGFSHSDGSSTPSKSHINGNNGDFKYLRVDKSLKCGTGTSLNIIKQPDSLDSVRQNKWLNALYKFGWKNFLGWSYKSNGRKQYLDHIPKNTANHFHHVHVQRYQPNFKEIRE